MAIVLIALLTIHGALHILGFLKSWRLSELPAMSGATLFVLPEPLPKLLGVMWLVAGALFLLSASVHIAHVASWWIIAAFALLLSQLLIVYGWPDAKYGTFVNVLLLLPIACAAGYAHFVRDTQRDVQTLWSDVPAGAPSVVSAAELEALPAPVQRWLTQAGVVGQPRARTVRLKQTGWMRTGPNNAWMKTRAEQYFRVDEPGFIWNADVHSRLMAFAGRDSYLHGSGRMLIKLFSLLPVVDAHDDKTDQGTLLRFLGEMVWFPSAALSPYLRWESTDEHSAKVTMTYRGTSGSAVFAFRPDGLLASIEAQRYYGSGAEAKLERWVIPVREWKKLGGCLIPSAGDVIWKLAGGDFDYYKWQIDEVEYNVPRPY